jgi:basic amino acid/polyamine antiporter, APA family
MQTKRNNFEKKYTLFEWKLIIIGLFISSFLLIIPFILHSVNSFFFLFLFFIHGLVSIFVFMSFSEYITSFANKGGGIILYLSQAYNRYIAFSLSFLLYLFLFLFLSGLLIYLLSFFSVSVLYSLLILFGLIILVHLIITLFPNHNHFILFLFSGLGILSIVSLFLFSSFNFFIAIPVFDVLTFESLSFIGFLFISLAICFVPFTFFIIETEDIEEEIPSFFIPLGKYLILLLPFLLFIFLGIYNSNNAINFLFEFTQIPFFNSTFIFVLILINIGLLIYFMIGFSKYFYNLADEGLFFYSFSKVNANNVPLKSIILQQCLLILLASLHFWLDLFSILNFTLLIVLLFILLFGCGIAIMQFKLPNLERPYFIKHWKLSSFIIFTYTSFGIISWFYITTSFVPIFLLILFLFLLFIPYFLFELYYNENMSTLTSDIVCYFSPFFSRLILSKKVKSHIIDFLGNVKDKTILDFGCSTGSVTLPLIEKVGHGGRIYATDKSNKSLLLLKKQAKKYLDQGYLIKFIKDAPSSVSPLISQVDAVISVGNLSSMRDIDYVLKSLNLILSSGSKISFVEYDKFFYVFKNKWLSDDEKIKNIFDRNGFGITLERKWGFFFQYVIITGIKFKNAYYMDTWYEKKSFD